MHQFDCNSFGEPLDAGRAGPAPSPHAWRRATDGVSMPRGPRGEKRPADVIGMSVKVMRIATGEEIDELPDPGKEYAKKGGIKGGASRAAKLSPERRKEIAKRAAEKRWRKS